MYSSSSGSQRGLGLRYIAWNGRSQEIRLLLLPGPYAFCVFFEMLLLDERWHMILKQMGLKGMSMLRNKSEKREFIKKKANSQGNLLENQSINSHSPSVGTIKKAVKEVDDRDVRIRCYESTLKANKGHWQKCEYFNAFQCCRRLCSRDARPRVHFRLWNGPHLLPSSLHFSQVCHTYCTTVAWTLLCCRGPTSTLITNCCQLGLQSNYYRLVVIQRGQGDPEIRVPGAPPPTQISLFNTTTTSWRFTTHPL